MIIVCIGFLLVSCGTSRHRFNRKNVSMPYFDPTSDYRITAPKINLAFKGIPIMDTFKSNFDLETLQIDNQSENKFICDSIRLYVLDLYKKQMRGRISKNKFEIIGLPSGANLIIPTDIVNDRRIFIVMSPGYYFVVRNCIIWFSCKQDKNGKLLGVYDLPKITEHQVATIKKLLFYKPLESRK